MSHPCTCLSVFMCMFCTYANIRFMHHVHENRRTVVRTQAKHMRYCKNGADLAREMMRSDEVTSPGGGNIGQVGRTILAAGWCMIASFLFKLKKSLLVLLFAFASYLTDAIKGPFHPQCESLDSNLQLLIDIMVSKAK